jgi:hypothetical protein
MTKIYELVGFRADSLNTNPNFVAGLECEIESVQNHRNYGIFNATEDGSLRNYGCEFISLPAEKTTLLTEFKNLHAHLEFYNRPDAFSPRTSTHVHVNCRSLDVSHVKNLTLLYALFEEFFFAMVDQTRRTNIHCVPLSETFLSQNYRHDLSYQINRWHKYTALNLLPLTKLGTVEFRHLQGTDDSNLLEDWLTTLENLWRLSQEVVMDAASLGNEQVINDWFYALFSHSKRVMALAPCLSNMIKNSLIDVKLSLV